MFLEDEEKIFIRLADEKLTTEKVKRLIDFCFRESDEIVLCQLKVGDHSPKVLNNIQLLRYEETNQTHCTQGPLTTIFHIKNDHQIKHKFDTLKDIYEQLHIDEVGTEIVEDPAFYKQGELLCSICSHEKIGCLFLTKDQYNIFYHLRIPHDLYNAKEQPSFEDLLKEYAYQDRTKLSMVNPTIQSIPDNIGQLTYLKSLEIFSNQLVSLNVSLEKLIHLELLRLTRNKVENLGFNIGKLKNLKVLDLGAMPLEHFPNEITELPLLQELYLDGLQTNKVPESLMNLKHLKVLVLPDLDHTQYSPAFIKFVEKLKPKKNTISLKDILGEETWNNLVESGNCLIRNDNNL